VKKCYQNYCFCVHEDLPFLSSHFSIVLVVVVASVIWHCHCITVVHFVSRMPHLCACYCCCHVFSFSSFYLLSFPLPREMLFCWMCETKEPLFERHWTNTPCRPVFLPSRKISWGKGKHCVSPLNEFCCCCCCCDSMAERSHFLVISYSLSLFPFALLLFICPSNFVIRAIFVVLHCV
jgi:hypothetical protein